MKLFALILLSVAIYFPVHAVEFVPEEEPVHDNPKVTFQAMPYQYDHDLGRMVLGKTLREVEADKQAREALKNRTSKEKFQDDCKDILMTSCRGSLYGAGIASLFNCQGMVSPKGIIYTALVSGLGFGVWKLWQIRADSECVLEPLSSDGSEALDNSAAEEEQVASISTRHFEPAISLE